MILMLLMPLSLLNNRQEKKKEVFDNIVLCFPQARIPKRYKTGGSSPQCAGCRYLSVQMH